MERSISFYLITFVALTFGFGGYAAERLDIRNHTVEVATPDWITKANPSELFAPCENTDSISVGEIVNLGKEIWKVIEANKPVVNVAHLYANALPSGVRSAEELDHFSDIQNKTYRMYGTNFLGMTVYDVTYTIVHRYGGSYHGRGRYLEDISVIPSQVNVLWGYTLDMGVAQKSTVNVGTSGSPIASLALEMTVKVSTVLKASETRSLFQFRGDSKDFKKM